MYTEFLVVWMIIFMFLAYILYRNQRVFEYRMKMNREMYNASIVDILHNKDSLWRRKVYEKVEYKYMLLHFWRKLDSFYPDKSFVTIEGDLEVDLGKAIKAIIIDSMPTYFKTDEKIDFDGSTKDIMRLLEIYMPVVAAIKKD